MTSPTLCSSALLFVRTSIAHVFVVALCGLLPSLAAAQSLPSGWTAADVGTPSVQGAATFDNGRFRVRGAGADIGGPADEFMFVYQQLTGDGDIVARVDRILDAPAGAKAGVMIRESLAADARHALVAVTAAQGLAFQRRLTGGLTTQTSGWAARRPMSVKLERRGSTINAFQSVDGSSWTLIGTEALSMQPTVLVGLAVTSHDVNAATEGTFANVAVIPATPVPAGPLPSGWTSVNIGHPQVPGSADYKAGTYTVRGAGRDIGSFNDEFHYVYRRIDGDTEIVARVTAVENVDPWTRAGIMIRDALTPNAAHYSMFVSASRGISFQRRRIPGELGSRTVTGTVGAPFWVRLERRGDRITAFQSPDGATWTAVGTGTLSLPSVYVGLALTSRDPAVAATAVFANVSVRALGNPPPSVSLLEPPNNSTTLAARTAIVTSSPQAIPSGWSAGDIGQPPVAGSANHNNGTFTVSGAGEMGWTADQFHYVYRSFTGDVDVISRVVTLQALQEVTKAGVMIRETLTPNSAYGAMFVSASDGMSFHRRLTTGGTRERKPGSTATAPRWVRLERRGTTVTASESADGVSWTTVGSITLSQANMFVGLAVASAVSNQAATAQFDNVIVRTPSTPNQPPAVTLTAPANGATFPANASITLTANAGDTDGTIADVRFFAGTTLIGTDTTSPYSVTWNNVPAGSYSLTAVARDDDNATTTSAARTITVTGVNQPPTVALTAPANGATFTAPATITLTATASDAGGAVNQVAFFAGTSLIGTDTSSPYSVTWNNVAAGTYALTAVARDNGGVSTTSAARTVIVTSSQSLPSGWSARDIGQPPVAGSATHNNGTFTVSGAGEMAWTADQFHYVYRSFTGDVEIISRVVTLQALQQWTKAGVMIREALTANSAYGAMFVSASGGMSFHRRLTTGGTRQIKPGSTARAPRWVRLERRGSVVTASESADGVSWTTVGSITLSQANMFVGLAVASAVSNQAATAQFDNVIVRTPSPPNQPPTVTLTAPANGATFPVSASITLSANASDTDGTIADVRFFAGTMLIGTDTTSPYSVTWNNVPAGTYSLTAVARDDDNATTTSGARSITVGTPPLLQFRAVFVASSNHSTAVNRYELKIFTAGSNPDTATPVATRDLGKPAVVGGECTVDITQTVQALSPGNYIATVTAIGPGGSARSAPAAFTR